MTADARSRQVTWRARARGKFSARWWWLIRTRVVLVSWFGSINAGTSRVRIGLVKLWGKRISERAMLLRGCWTWNEGSHAEKIGGPSGSRHARAESPLDAYSDSFLRDFAQQLWEMLRSENLVISSNSRKKRDKSWVSYKLNLHQNLTWINLYDDSICI